jgi:peptidoglycan/LPS O-acetylase OafA/YrhL
MSEQSARVVSLPGTNAAAAAERDTLGARFRRRFARRTTSGRLVPEIDGLRFPAIAIVVLGHLSAFFVVRGDYGTPRGQLDRLAAAPDRFAALGVLLFFIISGFVLALPFARHHRAGGERVRLTAYLMRRLTRLEPPYFLSLAVLAYLEIVAARHHMAGRTGTPAEILTHYAASVAYLHNMIFAAPSTINPPAWSLEIEIQFYLLVPLLASIFRVSSTALRRGLTIGACLVAIAATVAVGDRAPRFSLSILGNLQFFLLGFLLADMYLLDPWIRQSRRVLRWDAVSLVGWPALFLIWQRGPIGTALLPVLALALFIAAFRGAVTNRLFTNPWITTFGGMCYSIYLVHFEMVAAVGRGVRHLLHPTTSMWLDLTIEGPVILAVTLTACVAYYALIERPCMDPAWPRKLAAAARNLVRPKLAIGADLEA